MKSPFDKCSDRVHNTFRSIFTGTPTEHESLKFVDGNHAVVIGSYREPGKVKAGAEAAMDIVPEKQTERYAES